ncbi:MAG: putative peptidoglycan-binding domain-containing protein [Sulfurospirillum sp.]
MAKFNEAMGLFLKAEISNNPKETLHKNRGENGLTYMGIYQSAHPTWFRWGYINTILEKHDGNKIEASIELYQDRSLTQDVYDFMKKNFWDVMKLDSVTSQKIAEELFIFGTNANMKAGVKMAQRLIGVEDDGIVGNGTITALNTFNERVFDEEYDLLEQAYYMNLISRHPELEVNERGWIRRSELAMLPIEELEVAYV